MTFQNNLDFILQSLPSSTTHLISVCISLSFSLFLSEYVCEAAGCYREHVASIQPSAAPCCPLADTAPLQPTQGMNHAINYAKVRNFTGVIKRSHRSMWRQKGYTGFKKGNAKLFLGNIGNQIIEIKVKGFVLRSWGFILGLQI